MNITLIGEDGILISNSISFETALRMAKESGKDLVTINAKNEVYRIADAGKLKYERKHKERQQRAQKRIHKVKEIQISPNIDSHDLNTKMTHLKEFLTKGFKTKITMVLKGRQVSFKTHAAEKLKTIVNSFTQEGIATVDGQIKQDGRDIVVYLSPKK